MKTALFATTAAAALAAGSIASAQGITLFGDARLGLGYNVSNDGDIADGGDDDIRGISRVRFGVRMTGETPTGITYGATIRADNAIGGEGTGASGVDNQNAGNVFVSGTYGTLTFGDTNEAHQQHVGDLAELGLTGLGLLNELPYTGNREGGGPFRPAIRYDYDIAGFGVSASTGSRLDSYAVGASYALDFGGGSFTLGAGYFDGDGWDVTPVVVGDDSLADVEQLVVGVNGEFAGFTAQAKYLMSDVETVGDVDTLGLGLGTAFGAFGVNAIYVRNLDGPGDLDGADAYGVDMTYDLGGGARLKGGVIRYVDLFDLADPSDDRVTAADFGITMAF